MQGEQGEESIPPTWIPNTVTGLTAEDPASVELSGPKVQSFAWNLRGYVYEVTNDAWMAHYANVRPGHL
ncbi:MAG TPA: hypothetical protein VGJ20_46250 [Xanthobacteraceae bacterium]